MTIIVCVSLIVIVYVNLQYLYFEENYTKLYIVFFDKFMILVTIGSKCCMYMRTKLYCMSVEYANVKRLREV